jgi:hypothetical protein
MSSSLQALILVVAAALTPVLAGLAIAVALTSEHSAFRQQGSPVAHAKPLQPGDGDAFFIAQIQNDFAPTPSLAAIKAIIPLAHQACDARTSGQDDLQAAHLIWAGKGIDTGVDP